MNCNKGEHIINILQGFKQSINDILQLNSLCSVAFTLCLTEVFLNIQPIYFKKSIVLAI